MRVSRTAFVPLMAVDLQLCTGTLAAARCNAMQLCDADVAAGIGTVTL